MKASEQAERMESFMPYEDMGSRTRKVYDEIKALGDKEVDQTPVIRAFFESIALDFTAGEHESLPERVLAGMDYIVRKRRSEVLNQAMSN